MPSSLMIGTITPTPAIACTVRLAKLSYPSTPVTHFKHWGQETPYRVRLRKKRFGAGRRKRRGIIQF
jgi:hypothetical protein